MPCLIARRAWNAGLAGSLWLMLALPAWSGEKAKVDPVLDDLIQQAVDKGVAFLRKNITGAPGAAGARPSGLPIAVGGQALIGWTLLECGVPASDPVVLKLAEAVRHGVIDHDAPYGVYNLSTALFFIDKLGDPSDAPLIESITVRLLVSQDDQSGGWSYPAPVLGPAERARLKAVLKQRRDTVARGESLNDPKRTPEQTLQDLRRYAAKLVDPYGGGSRVRADNSNTQFAMMAMWVARRHQLPVGAALVNVGKRFRNSQAMDGTWTYAPHAMPGAPIGAPPVAAANPFKHPAMTCAGLLALALEKGAQNKTRDLDNDPAARKGLAYLADYLSTLRGGAAGAGVAPFPNPLGKGKDKIDRGGNYYYFLFSLERMAVVYDIKNVGETDWYAWGAEDLLSSQAEDGSWTAHFPEWHADTCFALLFLKKANIARDLTENFNRRPALKAPLRDPLLDLPFILPKQEKKKTVPKQSSRSVLGLPHAVVAAGPGRDFVFPAASTPAVFGPIMNIDGHPSDLFRRGRHADPS